MKFGRAAAIKWMIFLFEFWIVWNLETRIHVCAFLRILAAILPS